MSRAVKMAKARGDGGMYYGRSPYRGDLWGTIKKVGKAAVGFVAGGGIPGVLARGVGQALGNVSVTAARAPNTGTAATGGSAGPGFAGQAAPFNVSQALSSGGGSVPTNVPVVTIGPDNQVGVLYRDTVPPDVVPAGYHKNRAGYYRRLPNSTNVVYVPKGMAVVKNRRRNPMNGRAMMRSVGRVKMARKWAREVDRLFPHNRPRGKA